MPEFKGREVNNNDEDVNAGRERRPTVEADRDVRAPIPDSSAVKAMRDATYRYNEARDALNTLTAGLTDANGDMDYTKIDPQGNYGIVPDMEMLNHYGSPESPLGFEGDADIDDILREANDDGIELSDARQQMVDRNKRDLAEATKRYERRRKDLAKAAADLAKSDRTKRAQTARAILGIIGVGGVIGSMVLGYLLHKANQTKLGSDPIAFDVSDDTVSGYTPGAVAKVRVLAEDFGVDAGTLALVNADANGNIVVTGEGTWSIEGELVVFTPETGFLENPTPQVYTVSAKDAEDANGVKLTGTGIITLIYDGLFKVEGTLLTTFIRGKDSVAIKFLDTSKGADATTATLLAADAGTPLVKTVANEGVWTIDLAAKTLTFKVGIDAATNATFAGDPSIVSFSVTSNDGTRTATGRVLLIDADLSVTDVVQKADPGQAFDVTGISENGTLLDQSTIEIYDASGSVQNPLTISNEGVWSVDSAGKISFAPAKGFDDLPTPILASIEDVVGRRSDKFKISTMLFVPPYAPSEIIKPQSLDAAGNLVDVTLGQATSVEIATQSVQNILDGDFPIDGDSVQIIGLMPFDATIPSAKIRKAGKELTVAGEGRWRVTTATPNKPATIKFDTEANFARWPTPMAYSVADTKGHRSNFGLIWITPDGALLDAGNIESNRKTDDQFWADFSAQILHKTFTLSDILIICGALENMALSGIVPAKLIDLNSITIVDDATLKKTVAAFATAPNLSSPPALETVTAFVDNAYITAAAAPTADPNKVVKLGDVLLATRIARLRLIQSVITEVLTN